MPPNKNGSSTKTPEVVFSSDANLFADFGISDAEVHNIKALLSVSIAQRLDDLALSQSEIAKRYDIDQPKLSKIVRGKLDGFTIDRLVSFVEKLGGRVSISIKYN